jgi:SSS family solute:Na+ symporter
VSAPVIALAIVALVVVGTIAFALISVGRFRMEPQEFIVGNRSFGAVLLWILLAGEIYTSFTFLGAAGWAYGKGAAALYILVYGVLAFTIGYFYLPRVWRIGKERGLMTWPDFLRDRYGSNALATAVAILQFLLTVPYVTLQLSGLQILLTIAGYGRYNASIAVAIAFSLISFFVFTAGLRGTAWASVVKDALVLGAALFAGLYLPTHFFGSPAGMFDALLRAHPQWLILPAGSAPFGVNWYVSTIALSGIGFFMGAANAPSIFSAKDEATVRRNMIFMPVYQIVIVLVMFAGWTALLVAPGLKGPAADQSFMLVLQRDFPAWVLGLVAGAGCLAALLPASVLLLGAATVISRNVLGHTRWVRPLVLACAALALILWLFARTTLVDLLLFYYNGISQVAPGIMLGLCWKRVNVWAVAAGLVAGETVAMLTLHANAGPWGLNLGFVALCINVAVCVLVTLLMPVREVSSAPQTIDPERRSA